MPTVNLAVTRGTAEATRIRELAQQTIDRSLGQFSSEHLFIEINRQNRAAAVGRDRLGRYDQDGVEVASILVTPPGQQTVLQALPRRRAWSWEHFIAEVIKAAQTLAKKHNLPTTPLSGPPSERSMQPTEQFYRFN